MTKSSKKRWPLFQFLVNKIENFIVPTKRLIILLLGGMIFISIGAFFEGGLYLLVVFNGLILLLSCIDLYMLPKQKQLRINRHFPEKVDVGEEIEAAIEIINESGQPLSFSVTDDFPIEFEHPGIVEGSLTKPSTYVQYQVRAKERGQFQLNYLYFRYWGGLGLWMKQSKIEQTHEVKVYPDLSSVRGYLASTQEELILEGKKVNRRIRTGSEFNSIREYVPDDDPRFINWTASARQHKLMTNVFQPEKGKSVTILLDCGRMMGVELENQTKLDRTIEAACILATVALRQGDQVSLIAFSDQIKAYVPFGKGMSHLNLILESIYSLSSDFVESNYQITFEMLQRHHKKRSFMVLFSDMENYLFEKHLAPTLSRFRRQHLLLLLSLRDPVLYQWTQKHIESSQDAYIKSLAYKFSMDRHEYTTKMASNGIRVLDVPANQLALSTLNSYLEAKARDIL